MKIAFLTPEYPHPRTGSSGGIGTSIKNLSIGLLGEGCTVRIIVYGQKEESIFEENGLTIQQIKNVKFKGLSWFLTRKKLERIINQLYAKSVIDLVEAPDWTGITSFIQPKNCPIVIKLHGSDTYFCNLEHRPVKWVNRFHERRALQKADGLLSVSQFTADRTNEIFGLQKDFTIIPNAIDINLFNENFQANLEVPSLKSNSFKRVKVDRPMVFLYFGSLIRKKGILELAFIFNEVVQKKPDVYLVLIGKDVADRLSGNSSTWALMQELFTENALKNVSYLGSVSYEAIKSHIKKARVCIFPSFAEALPVSWIEAMAMQKPIVASDIGWAKEMIDEGRDGFMVHPKNHKLYTERILELLESPELLERVGIAARKKVVDKFSIEVVAKQSLLFYSKLNK